MDDDFDAKLQDRLAVIEDPGYIDPALRNLPARDVVLLIVGSVVLVALMWFWGHPA